MLEDGIQLQDYINEYMEREKNDRIHRLSEAIGLDEDKLRQIYDQHPTSGNINEFGRFDALVRSVDREKALSFIEAHKGEAIRPRSLTAEISSLLRKFLIGGYEELFTVPQPISDTTTPAIINIGQNIEHADTVVINNH